MLRIVTCIVLALVGACQPAFINGVPNENSPYFEVPVDSRLLLKRAVAVAAHEVSAYFQNGRTTAWYDVNQYGNWCVLQLDRKRDVAQTIQPDVFVVSSVTNERRYHLGSSPAREKRIQVATRESLSLATLGFDADDSETYEVQATVMRLQSSHQPDVVRLVCADWGRPQGGTNLTVQKIRRALGEFFTLELALHSR